jgi:hypothetical protein
MTGILSPSPFQISNLFPQIWSTIPEIACRISGRFQLQRQLRWTITFNTCIVREIREYRCIHLIEGFTLMLSIHRSDLRFALNRRISPRLRQGLLLRWAIFIILRVLLRFSPYGHSPNPILAAPLPLPAPLSPLPAAVVGLGRARPPPGYSPCAPPPPLPWRLWEEARREGRRWHFCREYPVVLSKCAHAFDLLEYSRCFAL